MMNLEKLIEARESIPEVTFPVPEEELLQRFEQLYTGAVNDVLREFCLLDQALPHRIQPLREYRTVAGFAFTVKSAPNVKLTGEMEYRTQMLDEMTPNAFVLRDTSSDEKATLWGGVMTATAKKKGVKAACIDGGIRDTHQILEAQFPVFYRYRLIQNGSRIPLWARVPRRALPFHCLDVPRRLISFIVLRVILALAGRSPYLGEDAVFPPPSLKQVSNP